MATILALFLNKKLGNKNFLATYTCSKNSNSLIVLAERKKFRFQFAAAISSTICAPIKNPHRDF